jgi:hypothetical protein
MTDAYRACPLCGTRSTYYMLVCRHCGRSLRRVPLVGTPPPGTVGGGGSGTFGRVALGAVALAAAAAAVVFTVKRLRPSTFEGAVAASEPTPAPVPPERTGWETLEQRLAELPPAPARSTSPAPDATRPLAVAAPASSGLSMAPPLSPGPAATATPNAGAGPVVAVPTPRPRRAAPAASPEAGAAAAERDAGDARSARRSALRRAEERVRSLERRRSSLRDDLGDEEITAGDRQRLEDELATVLLQLEDAEREVIRAEWALRSVEE